MVVNNKPYGCIYLGETLESYSPDYSQWLLMGDGIREILSISYRPVLESLIYTRIVL